MLGCCACELSCDDVWCFVCRFVFVFLLGAFVCLCAIHCVMLYSLRVCCCSVCLLLLVVFECCVCEMLCDAVWLLNVWLLCFVRVFFACVSAFCL